MLKGGAVSLILVGLLAQIFAGGAVIAAEPSIGPKGSRALTQVVYPLTSFQVLPNVKLQHGRLSDRLSVVATPGEYEPVSFVVTALTDIHGLLPRASDLVSADGDGAISTDNIDIKIVKCWFQAGTAWWGRDQDKSQRVLVPELLLNDPNLVRVDLKERENYLKLAFSDREEYVWISSPVDRGGRAELSPTEWPVQDSLHLLPVDIAARMNQQFWMTVKVPEDTPPGVYTGQVGLYEDGQLGGSMELTVKVLPFTLSPPYYESSIYYRGVLDVLGSGSISSERKSRRQYVAELENMINHGVSNPTIYQPLSSLEEVLRIRDSYGLNGQPLYYLGVRTYDPIHRIQETLALAERYGIPDVYFYAIDEATGPELAAQRPDWEIVHEVGGKVFAASWQPGSFELMGDIQDLFLRHAHLSKDEAARWHAAGHRIWSYGNPQSPPEDPSLFRRNYGYMLFKHDYDGAATYAYQDSFGNIWNDFDHPTFRDHNFTYPTLDGVIDTIAWEGYREGVDDIRYLTTLLEAIESAKESSDAELKLEADAAERYLSRFNAADDPDGVRTTIINHILRLKQLDS